MRGSLIPCVGPFPSVRGSPFSRVGPFRSVENCPIRPISRRTFFETDMTSEKTEMKKLDENHDMNMNIDDYDQASRIA